MIRMITRVGRRSPQLVSRSRSRSPSSGGSLLGEIAISNQPAHAAEYGSHDAAQQSHYHGAANRAIEQVCPHIRVPTARKVADLLGLLTNDIKKDHINDDERKAKQLWASIRDLGLATSRRISSF
jgi:hypothetical protein